MIRRLFAWGAPSPTAARIHAEALDIMARTALRRQRTAWVDGRNPHWAVG